MDLINYILILITSFLGLIIGILLSNMAVEEITTAEKYLKYLNIIIVPTIIIIAAYSINIIYTTIFAATILTLLIIYRDKYDYTWTYACMGALIYISTLGRNVLETTIIIFIYGISIATIEAAKQFRNPINNKIKNTENYTLIKKVLSKYSYYILTGIIFYTVFTYII